VGRGESRSTGHAAIFRVDLGNSQTHTSRVRAWPRGISFILLAVSTSVASARLAEPAASPQSPDLPPPLTPTEIELYRHARTLIDWTPGQIRDRPLLHKLQPPESQDRLTGILERVGQMGMLVFRDFPQISCDEGVFSEVFAGRRHTMGRQEFRYIVIPRPHGNVPAYEEFRTDRKGNAVDYWRSNSLSLTTSNFASTWLYLSPGDQSGGRFRLFGTQTMRNQSCLVVGFAQNPDRVRRVSGLHLGGKNVPLLFQDLAWIDPETFHILRVTTWLLAPRMDIGLQSQVSTVDFYPVTPNGSERTLWLPRDVKVDVVYRGLEVCNNHHYSNFKLFRVESTIKPTE